MNGILLINKPQNYTSRDVVNKLNHIFNTKRIGHTGTLDPLAAGLLIICIGKYTKLVDLITSETKEYIAKIKLGITTDTYDITGQVTATSTILPSKEEVSKVLKRFIKTYNQEVPKYSAVKIQGKKLYEYARNNENIKLPKRSVTIYSMELLSYQGDEIEFRCTVSKGTYIRSLIMDICNALNVCGTMSKLTRTKQGNISLEESFTLDEVEKGTYSFIPLSQIFPDYTEVNLTESEYHKVINGSKIPKNFNTKRAIYKYQNQIIALYEQDLEIKALAKPLKMLI